MAGETEIVSDGSPPLTGGETARPDSPSAIPPADRQPPPVEGEGEEGGAGIRSASKAHAGLVQLVGPNLRGVGPGAETRWQGVEVSVEPGKTPQEILIAAERELIEAYLRGSRYLLLLPKPNLLFFADDQPQAARLMREISAAHRGDPLLMLQLDIRFHRRERTNAEATFCVLPPESETYPDPNPIVFFELPHIVPELRQTIRLAGFEVEDLFLLLSGIPPDGRKVTLSRLGAFFDVRVGLPSPWKEKGYLMNLTQKVPPSDRAIFFVALRSVAFMHGLRVLQRELRRKKGDGVLEKTTTILRMRAAWLLSDEVRTEQGEEEWSRRIRVALTPGLGRVFSDRLYREELRTRLLTAFLNWLAGDRKREVSIPAAVDIVSSLMLQDPVPVTAVVMERYWKEAGWEELEAFVREACREITRRNWMEFPFDQALAEVPALRQEKRWKRISDPLLPKAFLPDEIEALVEGVPVSEQGPLADHVASSVEGDLLGHIASQPTATRAQLVSWIAEIAPEQRLQAVRYLRTLVAGHFSDEAVRAMEQSVANGHAKALRVAVHLQATHLLAQITDDGQQWYDDAGIAVRRMAVFCPNRESLDKLLEATLRSFGYEDLREEVAAAAREVLHSLLTLENPEPALTNILSRVHARPELHTVYSVACSFFSGMEDLPEAMEKLRLLEAVWAEVEKKGGGRGGAASAGGATGVVVEALSRAHSKGLRRTARVLQSLAQLAVAGKLTPAHLSKANLTGVLRSKGFGNVVDRLGPIDRIVLVAASSIRRNESESFAYLRSVGFSSAAAIPAHFPGVLPVPSLGSSAPRVIPTVP